MKRALEHRPYRNPVPFQAPDGIVTIQIDPASGMPASPYCPLTRSEVYIAGTQPVGSCPLHSGHVATNVAGWDTAPQVEAPPALAPLRPAGAPPAMAQSRHPLEPAPAQAAAAHPEEGKPKEKKGFFRRIWGVFK